MGFVFFYFYFYLYLFIKGEKERERGMDILLDVPRIKFFVWDREVSSMFLGEFVYGCLD
jgi:hypothetical protein